MSDTGANATTRSAAASQCPVGDWDYFAGGQAPMTAYRKMDALSDQHKFFRVDDPHNSYYVFTRYDAILDGLQRPDLFSSSVSVVVDPDPPYKWIPLQLDAPEHNAWRRLLGGYFSPGRVERLVPSMREVCATLIEPLAGQGGCDFMADFAQRFPSTIFLTILGLDAGDLPKFLAWEHRILHTDGSQLQDQYAAMTEVTGFFSDLLDERRKNPDPNAEDIVSNALNWRIDGEPCRHEDLLNCLLLLFMAGLDTVASQLGWGFYHLATHEADRRRIATEPAIHDKAVEEFLRAYPMVMTGRKVRQDVTFHGCPLNAGEIVMFPQPAAGRDNTQFPDAREVDLDRGTTRHTSFSAGPHRCLGSHLARVELEVALDEWHRRIPDYRLDQTQPFTEHTGGVFGLDKLPLVW
jgi:cytochrome P450